MTATEGVPAAAKPGGQPAAAAAAGRSWMEIEQIHSSNGDAAVRAACCD